MQQASRLGSFFSQKGIAFTHIFSSDLSRAFKTAESIRSLQRPATGASEVVAGAVSVVPELREQDFGYYEGKPFFARKIASNNTGNGTYADSDKDIPGFKDVESKESLARRADLFLDRDLMPLLAGRDGPAITAAVVSHGILLSTLWRCILRRQSPKSVTIGPELLARKQFISLEHIGGWSNTGYLELELELMASQSSGTSAAVASTPQKNAITAAERVDDSQTPIVSRQQSISRGAHMSSRVLSEHDSPAPLHEQARFNIVIKTANDTEHLKGLKRTGGGVGSSKFDEGQKSIESFFKRRKP